MEKTEAEIQRDITVLLEDKGIKYSVTDNRFTARHRSAKTKKGWPDITACVPPKGRFLAIEVKAKGGKLSEDQELRLMNLRCCGAACVVAHNVEAVNQVLRDLV
jgi:hypothetical protein